MNIKTRLVPTYDDAFYKRFPNLFSDVLGPKASPLSPAVKLHARTPLTEHGVECGIGWRAKIVEPLCVKLETMIAELPEKIRGGYRATQVKQKFNVLRLYMTRSTPEMLSAISDAEDESQAVCERCGKDSDGCEGRCK